MYTPRTWGCTRPTTPFAPSAPRAPFAPYGGSWRLSSGGSARSAAALLHPVARSALAHPQHQQPSLTALRGIGRLAPVIGRGDLLRRPSRHLSPPDPQRPLAPMYNPTRTALCAHLESLAAPACHRSLFHDRLRFPRPHIQLSRSPDPGSVGRFTYYPRPRGTAALGSLCRRDPPGLLVPGAARRCTRLPLVGRCAAGTRSGVPCRASVVSRKSALLHGFGCRRLQVRTA